MRDGEVSSSGGHLLFKGNRLQQTCYTIFILYPLKTQTPFLCMRDTSSLWKIWFVNLDKSLRWVEWHWEDHVSVPRHSLLLYARMAGAARSWWWGKAQVHSNMCLCNMYLIWWSVFLLLITQPTSGLRTVRSCCPHPTTPLALISHYKPSSGYVISGSQTSTFSPRFVCLFMQVNFLAQSAKFKKNKILTHCHSSVPNCHSILSVFTLAEFQVFEIISKKHLFL